MVMGVVILIVAAGLFGGVAVAAAIGRHWPYLALALAGLALMGCVAMVAAGDW